MRLFIKNLPYSVTETDLHNKLSAFGLVYKTHIPANPDTGQSRGFGFVTLPDEAAIRAIEELNGSDWGGRRITVEQAREREPKGKQRESAEMEQCK